MHNLEGLVWFGLVIAMSMRMRSPALPGEHDPVRPIEGDNGGMSWRRPFRPLRWGSMLVCGLSAAACGSTGSDTPASPPTITVTVEAPDPSASTAVPSAPGAGGPEPTASQPQPSPPTVATAPAPAAPTTQIVILRPINADGTLAAGWRVDTSQLDSPAVDCSYDKGSQTAMSPGTHQCGSNADSCHSAFTSTRYPGQVLCLFNAWEKVLHARRATGLRSALTPAPPAPEPLGLKLVDGTTWTLRTGGSWGGRADDYIGAYYCAASTPCGPGGKEIFVLVKQPPTVNRSTPLWTVLLGELGDPQTSYPAPRKVGVATAWFIAAR